MINIRLHETINSKSTCKRAVFIGCDHILVNVRCALRSNLKRELGFTLRLSPDDERDDDAHAEQDTESDNIPHSSSAQDSQKTEA